MNIDTVRNVQFTGRLKVPATLKNGNYEVNIINDYLTKSYKGNKNFKKLEYNSIPLEGNKKRNLTTVSNYSNGIKSKIFKEEDSFHRMDCNLNSGLYIGDFTINKNPKGEINSVSFYDPIGGESEIVVGDSKDLESVRSAFRNYNEHIKEFYKKDCPEQKPYPVNLLGY